MLVRIPNASVDCCSHFTAQFIAFEVIGSIAISLLLPFFQYEGMLLVMYLNSIMYIRKVYRQQSITTKIEGRIQPTCNPDNIILPCIFINTKYCCFVD